MSFESQIANRRLKRIGPIGKISAILTASAVSVIGVTLGLEPHIILWRAFVAAILIGSIVAFGISVIQTANLKR